MNKDDAHDKHEHRLPSQLVSNAERSQPAMVVHSTLVDNHGDPLPDTHAKRRRLFGWIAKLRQAESLNVILTAIIAVSAVTQLVSSCNNNKATSAQVDRLIEASDDIAGSAQDFADAAGDINVNVNEAVDRLGTQARRLRKTAEQTERVADQSRIANKESQDQFYEAQRPYLTEAIGMGTRPYLNENAALNGLVEIAWDYRMLNYGKSVANHVHVTQEMQINNEAFVGSYDGLGHAGVKSSFRGNSDAPGGGFMNTVYSRPLPRAEAIVFLNSLTGISIRVKVTYKGSPSSSYKTTYCLFARPDSEIGYCNSNEDTIK